MNGQAHTSHPKGFLALSFSKGLERVSYYGLRSLLVLYITSEAIAMSTQEALELYGWFTMLFAVSGIAGAIIGDLGIGNKKAVVYGAALQAAGAFALCITNAFWLYAGLSLIMIGTGLYQSNFSSIFGKRYLDRTHLLDSGFSILTVAIFLGAFIAPVTIGYMGSETFNYGFIVVGISMLLSLALFLSVKPMEESTETESQASPYQNFKLIGIMLAFLAFLSVFIEIADTPILGIQLKLTNGMLQVNPILKVVSSSYLMIPFGIIAAIVWTKRYSSQFFKLAIGSILTLMSLAFLIIIPDTPSDAYLLPFVISMLLMAIAQTFLAPLLLSFITQYANPKYLAIIMSLALIPSRLFHSIAGLLYGPLYNNTALALAVATIGIALVSLGAVFVFKKLAVKK